MRRYFIKIVCIGMLFNFAPVASSSSPKNKPNHSSTKKSSNETQFKPQASAPKVNDREAAFDCDTISSVKDIPIRPEKLFHSIESSKLSYEIMGQSFTRSVIPKYGESFTDIRAHAKRGDIWPDKTGCNFKVLDQSNDGEK